MTVRRAVPFVVSLLLLGAAGAGVLAWRGTSPGALRGVVLGLVLGAGGLVVESMVVSRLLRRPGPAALGVLLGGFAARLVIVVGATLLLHASGLADAAAFAVCFLAGFLAALPVLGLASAGEVRA